MKNVIFLLIGTFLIILGCSRVDDISSENQSENLLKSAPSPSVFGVWDDNPGILRTVILAPPSVYTAPAGYPAYVATNYDLITHFNYISSQTVTSALIEFTFPHILYFVPHITKPSEFRTYSVNNYGNNTVISCTADLTAGMNPMFCFMVKVDCVKGNSGFTTVWTDMKVNGVSVKGPIKNKIWACN